METEKYQLDVNILSSLLYLAQKLTALSDKNAIISATCQELAKLPGVEKVVDTNSDKILDNSSQLSFPLYDGSSSPNYLLFFITDPSKFTPYKTHLYGFIDVLSVVLKNINHAQITEEKTKIEQTLYGNQNVFQNIFENTMVGICLTDIDGNLKQVNPAFAKIFGYPPEEYKGMNFSKLTYEADIELSLNRYRDLLNGKTESEIFEKRYIDKNGKVIFAKIGTFLVKDKDGKALYFITHINDITSLKKTLDALKISEQRFDLAMRGANDGLWDWNLISNDVYYSPRWKSMLGYAADELENCFNTWSDRVHPDDIQPALKKIEDYLSGQTKKFQVEFRAQHKKGHWVPILSRGYAVRDKKGKPTRFVGTHIDITEQRQHEEKIQQLNQELEQRVLERTSKLEESLRILKKTQKQLVKSEKLASLGGIVAGIANELNSPLGNGITGASFLSLKASELIKQKQPEEDSNSAYSKFISEIAECADLISINMRHAMELLHHFKQVAVNQNALTRKSINVFKHVSMILTNIQPKLTAHNHQINLECPENLTLETYPEAWNQILENLIMNSLLHGFNGASSGQISIKIEPGDEQVLLQYKDNGRGMDEKTCENIFEPFFTTLKNHEGTGLGMYIVYTLVTQTMGGQIVSSSSPSAGTIFTITLPINHIS